MQPEPIGPTIDPSAFLSHGAVVIGQVKIGKNVFIGPNCVLRGDIEPIVIEDGANLQDNVTVHTHAGNPVRVGRDASVGHGAVVHGATLEPSCLIGMNAVVLDRAVVGEASVVGALALVPDGFQIPPKSLAVGVPCKVIKENDPRIETMARENGKRYHGYHTQHTAKEWAYVTGQGKPAGEMD